MINKKQLLFKSGFPITFYLLILALLIQVFILAKNGSFGKVLFYSSLTFLFFYLLLLRFSCKLKVKKDILEIYYVFPWNKRMVIDLSRVESLDYAKGFYDLFSNQSIGGLFVFPKYCYDQFIFKLKGEDELLTININTRIFQFNKCFKILKALINNKTLPRDSNI